MIKKTMAALLAAALISMGALTGSAMAAPRSSGSDGGNGVDARIAESVESYLLDAPENYVRVYNVKSKPYSAKGDGAADDTAAIQKALNDARDAGGGIVHLPKGTYKTSENLYVYSNTKVLGYQAKVVKVDVPERYAVFEIAPNQSKVVIEGLSIENQKPGGNIGVDFAQNVKNVWILNNTFQGNSTQQAVNINATGVKHIQVSGNHFEEVAYGVLTNLLAMDVMDVRVVDNQFINIHGDAVELNHPGEAYVAGDNFVIAGNYISVPEGYGTSDGAGLGIGIAGATHVSIVGNVIENARYEAIHIEDEAKHISIVGNIINGVQNVPAVGLNSGVYIIDGDYITISDNSIFNAQDYGIHLEYAANNQATNVVINGNTISKSKKGGIRVAGYDGDADIIVSGNIVKDNQGNGIHVGGDVRHLKITDNIVRNNTGYGLFLENSGLGWYLSGNTLYGNASGDIGFGPGYKVPVPLRNNGALFNAAVQVEEGSPAGSYTPWTDAFSLGSGAEGTLYASATLGTTRSTKIYKISWNGSELTATQIAHDIEGGLEVDTPRMNGSKLQLQAYSLSSGTVTFDVQFEGMIMLK